MTEDQLRATYKRTIMLVWAETCGQNDFLVRGRDVPGWQDGLELYEAAVLLHCDSKDLEDCADILTVRGHALHCDQKGLWVGSPPVR